MTNAENAERSWHPCGAVMPPVSARRIERWLNAAGSGNSPAIPFTRRCAMSKKILGRFKHINRGIVIEDGREIEFCIQFKSGDECTVQLPVGDIPRVLQFLQALQMQASDE
jgi:hypothetical protein